MYALLFSSYLSQILTKLLETLTSLQGIKIYIHVCSLREVILFLFGTINFTTKNRSQLVWTSFFWVVDRLGPVFKGLVAVPEYLKLSRPVAVASCLVLRKKNRLNWTWKHYLSPTLNPSKRKRINLRAWIHSQILSFSNHYIRNIPFLIFLLNLVDIKLNLSYLGIRQSLRDHNHVVFLKNSALILLLLKQVFHWMMVMQMMMHWLRLPLYLLLQPHPQVTLILWHFLKPWTVPMQICGDKLLRWRVNPSKLWAHLSLLRSYLLNEKLWVPSLYFKSNRTTLVLSNPSKHAWLQKVSLRSLGWTSMRLLHLL